MDVKTSNRYSSLKELYEHELYARGLLHADIKLVLSFIRESPIDENLSIMDNDSWVKLKERNLLEVFDEINKTNGIVWSHSNEPEK